MYYLEDQDIEDDIPEDYEEDYEPSTPSQSSEDPEEHSPEQEELQQRIRCRAYEETIMKVVRQQQQRPGDDRIIPLIMFDGGSFKHIWGTDMQQTGLLFNYQELSAPVKVDTEHCGMHHDYPRG